MSQQKNIWVDEDSATVRRVEEASPEAILGVEVSNDQTTLVVDKEAVVEVARLLRDEEELRYDFLVSLTGVDYLDLGEAPRFAVMYHLYSISHNHRVRLKVPVEEFDPVLPSVTGVWSTANWHEREVFDMFGLRFEGHPELRRILMPEDWDGHPLRKDYPLGYEEVAFTHNYEEVYARKPHPEE